MVLVSIMGNLGGWVRIRINGKARILVYLGGMVGILQKVMLKVLGV